MKVPYRISENSISVMVDNRMRVVHGNSVNFEALRNELRKPEHDLNKIMEFADFVTFVSQASFGEVEVSNDKVRWRGKDLHHVICDRLLALLKEGSDLEPLALFLNRLMSNPLQTAQNELYQWLEAGNAPITPMGTFLAFKAVSGDYKDKHSGKFDNSVGQIVEMPRDKVDPDRNNECSYGLHFCQYGYLSSFLNSGDRLMIVEIDPADVVAIPKDYSHQKGRTWRYTVVGEVPSEEISKDFFSGLVVDDRYHRQDNSIPDDEQESEESYILEEGYLLERDEDYCDPEDYYDYENEQHKSDLLDALDNVGGKASDALNKALQTPLQPVSVDVAHDRIKHALDNGLPDGDHFATIPVKNTQAPLAPLSFVTSDNRTFTAQDVLDSVRRLGQRGAAHTLRVARSTLRGWLSRLS